MFKIEHEDDTKKTIKLDTDENGIDDINLSRSKPKIKKFDEEHFVDDLGLDFIANETKRNYEDIEESIPESNRFEESMSVEQEEDEEEDEPIMTHEEIQHQKAYYLSQLHRLETKGCYASRKLGIEHPLNVIKGEYLRIKKEREIDNAIQYCRTGLMFCVSSIEMINNKYDPFNVDLDGWSSIIMAEKEKYDEVFEELYEKYHSKISMEPEYKLIAMVAGSAMMFGLQKSLMNKQNNKNDMFSSVTNLFMGNGGAQKQKQEMKGPSIDTDSLLDKLNNDIDSESDISDISEISIVEKEEVKSVNIPKRGRPKKK